MLASVRSDRMYAVSGARDRIHAVTTNRRFNRASWRPIVPTRRLCCFTLLSFVLGSAACPQDPQPAAEKPASRPPPRHVDVLAFGEALPNLPPVARLGERGTSGEGRKLPLVTLAAPPVATPEE